MFNSGMFYYLHVNTTQQRKPGLPVASHTQDMAVAIIGGNFARVEGGNPLSVKLGISCTFLLLWEFWKYLKAIKYMKFVYVQPRLAYPRISVGVSVFQVMSNE